MVTQATSSRRITLRDAGYLFLLASIAVQMRCASTVPRIHFKEIMWEEIDLDKTPTQEDYPNTNAVFLLDEGEFSVNRHVIFTRHVVLKVLTETGLEYANVEIPFHSPDEVHNIQGRTIRRDGSVVELKSEDIHEKSFFPEYMLYADSKAKVFAMPGVEVGSVIDYSYSVVHEGPFAEPWEFQRREPILLSRFVLDIPAAFKYCYLLSQRKGVEVEKHIYEPVGRIAAVFKVRNAPVITYEPFMPPRSEVVTKIYFSLASLSWLGIKVPVEGESWEVLGHNCWSLLEDKVKSDRAITAHVDEIIEDCETDMDKIAAIYDFLQSQIRYVAIEMVGGRSVPHEPSEVFENKYGDCKDKAFLLVTMLKEAGIDAYPVLTRTSDAGEVVADFVSYQHFNHMVVAVPASYFTGMEGYEDVVIEGEREYTSSDDYVLLDATSRVIPFGQIPWYLEGTRALLIREAESRLMTIPSSPANANKTVRECGVEIEEDGTFVCLLTNTKTGQEAAECRSLLQALSEQEQKEWFEAFLSHTCPGSILQEHSISGAFEPSKPLTLSCKLRIPQYAQKIENLLTFGPSFLRYPMVDKLTRRTREHSIVFDYCKAVVDVVNIEVPWHSDIRSLPDPLSRSASFGDYSFSCFTDGEKIIMQRQFVIKNTIVPREDYEEVTSFLTSISTSERENAVLCRK